MGEGLKIGLMVLANIASVVLMLRTMKQPRTFVVIATRWLSLYAISFSIAVFAGLVAGHPSTWDMMAATYVFVLEMLVVFIVSVYISRSQHEKELLSDSDDPLTIAVEIFDIAVKVSDPRSCPPSTLRRYYYLVETSPIWISQYVLSMSTWALNPKTPPPPPRAEAMDGESILAEHRRIPASLTSNIRALGRRRTSRLRSQLITTPLVDPVKEIASPLDQERLTVEDILSVPSNRES